MRRLTVLVDSLLVLVVLTNLAFLGAKNLGNGLRLLAVQGVVVGALVPLLDPAGGLSSYLLGAGVGALKGGVYPWVLARILRRLKTPAEEAPVVGFSVVLFIGILALGGAFLVAPRITPAGLELPTLALPVALATIICGLTVTMTHRTALAQVMGYVLLENGVFLFALCLVGDLPLLLELGGLLEVFFAVFVMGIAVDRISREFSTIDLDALDRLKG